MTYADYLKHHGIKGQKLGVQNGPPYPLGSKTAAKVRKKYYDENGSLNKRGVRKLERETKKLHKLQDKANVDLQRERAEKYGQRAKNARDLAIKTAAASYALDKGGSIASKNINKMLSDKFSADSNKIYKNSDRLRLARENAHSAYRDDYDRAISNDQRLIDKAYDKYNTKVTALNTVDKLRKGAAIGIAGVSMVSSGVAVYNKVQQKMAEKRVSEVGHAKAEARVQEQMDKMFNMFGDMKYEDFVKQKDEKSK